MAVNQGKQQPISQSTKLSLIVLVLTSISASVYAGEKENHIIKKSVDAYGGAKLLQLSQLTYTDSLYHYFDMQSGHSLQGPFSMHLNQQQIEVSLDLTNNNKAFKRTTARLIGNHGKDNTTTAHQVFVDGKGFEIDHCLQSYHVSNRLDFNNTDLGFSQMLDPIIIKQLLKDKEKSQWQDTAYIQGQAHDVITVNAKQANEYTLYLNQKTGYLSRMLQQRGAQTRTYDFLAHQQTDDGISWATQLLVSTDAQPIYHTTSRELSFEPLSTDTFKPPTHYALSTQPKMIDVSTPMFKELAENVYYVGLGWGYTLFIDVGDYYVSAGAWHEQGAAMPWREALALLRKNTQNNKPVAKHIVSHHHTDHMAGLSDIVEMGTNLVLHPTDIPAVQRHLPQKLTNDRFEPISTTRYLANGKIMLFDVPTSHASHNLALYLPEHQILFTEDLFGSSFETVMPSPNSWPVMDTYQRLRKLDKQVKTLDLPVKDYVSSHHKRVLSQADIDHALTLSCPSNDALTSRLFQQAP